MYIEVINGAYEGMRGYVKKSSTKGAQVYLYKDGEGFDVYGISLKCIQIIQPSKLLTGGASNAL